MPKFQTVRGMRDFLPADAEKLRQVEAAAKEVARLYGFEEIITPVVEYYDLLAAKSGEEIKARMYAFTCTGAALTMRPVKRFSNVHPSGPYTGKMGCPL